MVELYTIRKGIDGLWYEDVVAARSWEEAEIIAEKIGGEVTGKIVEEISISDEEFEEIVKPRTLIMSRPRTDGYEI